MVITSESKFELNLLIDKKSQKVLFTEVRKDVVNFLFRLLSLPIGSVTKLITDESAFGTLQNTYRSWEQLDNNFLYSTKMTANSLIPLISPTCSSNFPLILSSSCPATAKQKVYETSCKCKNFTDIGPNIIKCPSCHNANWGEPLSYVGPSVTKEAVERDGYVRDGLTYAVMDDLSMVPILMSSAIIEILNKMVQKDLSLVEKKAVCLNVQKGLELLKTSFRSKNVLTDIFLANKKDDHAEEAS